MARTGQNIYKRKDGRWEARYMKSRDENGKIKYGYIYARSYKEVRQKLLLRLSELPQEIEKIKTDTEKERYDYWIDAWLKSIKLKVRDSSYIRYRNLAHNHVKPYLGKYSIKQINTAIVEQYISQLLHTGRKDKRGGLSPETVSNILYIVKDSLRYAQSEGIVHGCILERLTIKRNISEMRVLSKQEEKKLLQTLLDEMDRYKLGVFLCLYTGIRLGELCALKWEHISLSEKTLSVKGTMQRLQWEDSAKQPKTHVIITGPKSSSALRIIPLPAFVVEPLSKFKCQEDAFLLTGKKAAYIEPRTMQNKFKTYLKRSKVADANFHSLRHTFATRCIEAGFDAKSLSEILGHSSVKLTLDKYVHSSMAQKRNNMEKLSSPHS